MNRTVKTILIICLFFFGLAAVISSLFWGDMFPEEQKVVKSSAKKTSIEQAQPETTGQTATQLPAGSEAPATTNRPERQMTAATGTTVANSTAMTPTTPNQSGLTATGNNYGSGPKTKMMYKGGGKTAVDKQSSQKTKVSSVPGQTEPIRQEVVPVKIKTDATMNQTGDNASEFTEQGSTSTAPEPKFKVHEVTVWAFADNWYTFNLPNNGNKYLWKVYFDGDVDVRNDANEIPVELSDQEGTLGYNKEANRTIHFRSKTGDVQEGTLKFWRVS